MRIVHITPHLPPDQAANALLPFQLGEWAAARGDSVHYVAHPPCSPGPAIARRANVTWMPRTKRSLWQTDAARWDRSPAPGASGAKREAIIEAADVVHVHSNGLLPEVGARLAHRLGKPVVLTLYGTEIWHYRPKRSVPISSPAPTGSADAVTFYSQRLLERARELGLRRRARHVIYPPVARVVRVPRPSAQQAERRALGHHGRAPARQRQAPASARRPALPDRGDAEVVREHPDTRLVICGTGALLPELQAVARSAGVERHVTFAGLVDNALVARYCAAADLFVLPSLLEALPTVAVEALACGTPVISSDNPGGVELHGVFGDDVAVVPKEQPAALAAAIQHGTRGKRRTQPSTQDDRRSSGSAPTRWRGGTSRSTRK